MNASKPKDTTYLRRKALLEYNKAFTKCELLSITYYGKLEDAETPLRHIKEDLLYMYCIGFLDGEMAATDQLSKRITEILKKEV